MPHSRCFEIPHLDATEVDMLESVECVLAIDLTDPPPEGAQHGGTARVLAFTIAQEEAVAPLAVRIVAGMEELVA